MNDENTQLILNTLNRSLAKVTTDFNSTIATVTNNFNNTIVRMRNDFNSAFEKITNTLTIYQNKTDKNFNKIFEILDEHSRKFEQYDEKFDKIDKKFDNIDKKFGSYDEDIKEIKSQLHALNNTVTKIEYEHDRKIQIGLEKLSMVIDKTDTMQESLDKINSKLDKHDVHIEVLEEKAL